MKYANGGAATSTQGLAYSAFSTVSYPVTAAWGNPSGSVKVTVNLKADANVLRLAKGSPNFAGGNGFAELDSHLPAVIDGRRR